MTDEQRTTHDAPTYPPLAHVYADGDEVQVTYGTRPLHAENPPVLQRRGQKLTLEQLVDDSTLVNALAWRMAVALGDVPHGATSVVGDPAELLGRLLADRRPTRAQLRGAVEAATTFLPGDAPPIATLHPNLVSRVVDAVAALETAKP